MIRKKIIASLISLIIILQVFMPLFWVSYAIESEENLIDENIVETKESNEDFNDELEKEDIDDEINKDENTEEESEIPYESNVEIESEEKIEDDKNLDYIEDNDEELNDDDDYDELFIQENADIGISVASASGYGFGAGNESEFSNLFYNTGVSEITTSQNIILTSTYWVNHSLRIDTSSSSGQNALGLASGCSIVVASGHTLVLDEMVIEARNRGNNDGKSCITVQNGATLILTGHSIIDGGTGNWGINVESGGNLLIESCRICYCNRGIVLQGGSYCDLASSTVVNTYGYTGKNVDIDNNSTGIYCGGAYRGNLIVNHASNNSEKINFEYNTYGIYAEGHSGNINIKNARMVGNGWAIYTFR